jgi:mxaK protein
MIILLLISLSTTIWSASKLYQAYVYNRNLHGISLLNNESPDALFANATRLAQRGDNQKALALYARVATSGDLALRKAAYYNSANLYSRQATALLEQEALIAWDRAAPLLALAKESYREALRLDPDWREAKYNYELALRLVPTIDSKNVSTQNDDEIVKEGPRPSGWPSIPGFPRGMP